MNAPELYAQLLEDYLTPFFISKGFKKSSGIFHLDHQDSIAVIQPQKSRWTSQEEVSFTFNLGIFDKFVYTKLHSGKTLKSPKPADCVLEKRIGRLLKDGQDKWYTLSSAAGLDSAFNDVEYDFEESVFPWFNNTKDLNDLEHQYKTDTDVYIRAKGVNLYIALHSLRGNDPALTAELFKTYYAKISNTVNAADQVKRICTENGVEL